MGTQYDNLAQDYELTHQAPLRCHIEAHTFLNVLGDVRGQKVLDLACRDGLYSRQLKRRGALEVTAVDISEGMIAVARAREEAEPLGIEYRVADVAALGKVGTFDLVTAVYLLHYAPDANTLARMCKTLHDNLRPGGRLVSVCASPDFHGNERAPFGKYGFTIQHEEPLRDGSVLHVNIAMGPLKASFSAFHWSREAYEGALREAGFRGVTWLRPSVSDEGAALFGRDFWQDYLENPHLAVFECTR
jgi:SAM-dependent methyltransferase